MSFDSDKLLDAWLAPTESGAPVACVATTFTFEAGFFDEECLARFLGLDAAIVTGGDETDTLAYILEREETLSDVRATVLVDRSYSQAAATFRWDVIPVHAGRGGVQHSKIALLLWEKRMRLIVASANLTQPGYRSNIEIFSVFDDSDPAVPSHIFSDAVGFLRTMVDDHTQGATGDDSPRGRLRASLRLVDSRLRARQVTTSRRGPRCRFLHTLRSGNLLEQAFQGAWDDRSRPSYYVAATPFFDREGTEGLEALSESLAPRSQGVSELAVIAEEAGDGQVKVDVPEHLRSLSFRAAPELLAWPDTGERALHAKSYLFGNGRRVMHISGSPNATAAGLALGQLRNIEAAVAVSDRANTGTAQALEGVLPELEELPQGDLIFDAAATAEEEDRPLPLPAGFVEALYLPDDNTVVITLDPRGLPETWEIRRGEDIWAASSDSPAPERKVRRALGEEHAPRSLTVEWETGAGRDIFVADLVVSVADAAQLPDPPEIQALTLEELLDLLAVGGRLHDLLRRLVARRIKSSEPGGAAPPELDPHRRVDTSQFMLQRTRRISYALEGLKRKLGDPIANADALERRLRGPFGATGLKEAADRAVEDGRMSVRERAFLLAELALVISRVEWKPVGGGVSARRCRTEARAVLEDIRPEASGDSALDIYVASAFREAT